MRTVSTVVSSSKQPANNGKQRIKNSTELVKAAHSKGLSIEAEVGSIGGEEDGVIGMGECADPKECKSIADLGVDFLAAGIGNIHGKYPANWKGLSFETLAAVQIGRAHV